MKRPLLRKTPANVSDQGRARVPAASTLHRNNSQHLDPQSLSCRQTGYGSRVNNNSSSQWTSREGETRAGAWTRAEVPWEDGAGQRNSLLVKRVYYWRIDGGVMWLVPRERAENVEVSRAATAPRSVPWRYDIPGRRCPGANRFSIECLHTYGAPRSCCVKSWNGLNDYLSSRTLGTRGDTRYLGRFGRLYHRRDAMVHAGVRATPNRWRVRALMPSRQISSLLWEAAR